MPFGNNPIELLTITSDIGTAQTLHLSPEKDTAGVVASAGVDRHNARHPGAIYHPLMVAVSVDGAITTNVSIDVDHGSGAAFDHDVFGLTAIAPYVGTGDGIIFNLEGDFPGLLILPKGGRTAPDSLRILIAASASRTASTTIVFEILGS